MTKIEKIVEKALVKTFTNDLIEIYNTQGEQAFRNTAKFLRLTDEDIEDTLIDLRKVSVNIA